MTTRTKAIGGLTLVFLLGGICGALVLGVVLRDRVRDAQSLRDRDGFVEFFERRLELTEAQRDSLRDELLSTYQQLAELRSSASAEYNRLLDSLHAHIYPQLTGGQRALLTQEEERLRRMVSKERGPRMAAATHEAARANARTPAQIPGPGRDTARVPAAAASAKTPAEAPRSPQVPVITSAPMRTDTSMAAKPPSQVDRIELPPMSTSETDLLAGVEGDQKDGAMQPRKVKLDLKEALRQAKLTRDQLAQIVAITRATNQEVRTLLANSQGVPPDRLRAMIREKRRDGRRKALAVMTLDQRKRFIDNLKAQRQQNAQ